MVCNSEYTECDWMLGLKKHLGTAYLYKQMMKIVS
jgi:hypothetical protein